MRNKDEFKQTLESVAQNYAPEDEWEDSFCVPWEAELIMEHSEPDDSIIEIGTSTGYMTEILGQFFKKEYYCIEGSKHYSEILKKRLKQKKINHCRVKNLLVEDYTPSKNFDKALLMTILEHVEDPPEVLKKVKSFLSPGGRIFCSIPNGKSFHRRLGFAMKMVDDMLYFAPQDIRLGHKRIYHMELFKEHCAKAGLTIEKSIGVFFKPLSYGQMQHWNKKILRGLFDVGKELPEYTARMFFILKKNDL